jgi:hypothetical protein
MRVIDEHAVAEVIRMNLSHTTISLAMAWSK